MSRSGYSDDLDPLDLGRWRGCVASAIRGRRGQALLRDLVEALDALPEKKLVAHELKTAEGCVCALGAVAMKRGVSVDGLDPDDAETLAATFDIATPLAQEIVFENDEALWGLSPESRWQHMRDWAVSNIRTSSNPEARND